MGQALYRKYRSKTLNEIVGQEHITETLAKAVQAGRISHAYLFTGPRGVGKTSIARILAHDINQLPYDELQTHMDIIEIDAASNRRIDEIRDLRDKVHVAPAQAKYKVYIIDEVHMLTKEAFNALLKTLEEPPAHVVFILATTEAHKLPETIISRTQRYIFRPIEAGKATGHLKMIAEQEQIKIDDAALDLIARHGDGSFRDSISLLDQASSHGEAITSQTIQSLLGIPPAEALTALLSDIEQQSSGKQLLGQLSGLYDQGFQAPMIAQQLASLIRAQVIQATIDSTLATGLLTDLLEVPTSHDPERFLEIILLKIAAPTHRPPQTVAEPAPAERKTIPKTDSEQLEKPSSPTPASTTTAVDNSIVVAAKETAKDNIPEPIVTTKASQALTPLDTSEATVWKTVLDTLKQHYNTLYGIVRMAHPTFQADKITLTFAFAFHQKRAHEAKNLKIIRDAFANAMGSEAVTITCDFDPDLKLKRPAEPAAMASAERPQAPNDSLANISNIFGTTEVLQ